jgi:hypothetical protein
MHLRATRLPGISGNGRRNIVIPPPLDGLPAASFAFGPRKMRSAYSGAAMRVRRADNAELDIGFATTPQTRTNLMPVPLVDNGPALAGITTTQVGSGTEFGLPYVDVRWQGTATAAGVLAFRQGAAATYNPDIHAAVTPGLVYTASLGYRLIAGTAPTPTLTMRLIQRAANAASLSFGSVYNVPAPTAAMQRAVAMDVIIPGVVYAHAQFGYALIIGDVVDVTLRFYANNLELGIGNIKPLLQRNVPEVVAGVGDLDTNNLMRFVAQDNLFQRSQEFDDAYWTKAGGAVTANAATAPDGTMTADVFVEDSAAATQHRKTRASLSLTTGQTVTLSAFVKRDVGTRQYQLGLSGGALVARAYFDLGAGVVGDVSQCTAAIEPASESYWRVSITAIAPSTASYTAFLAMANGLTLGSETYSGDGVSSVAEWGAQLNSGPLAPYNATTSAGIALAPAQSGFITTRYDQTGNGRHEVQAVAANQEAIVTGSAVRTINQRPIAFFDGTNTFADIAAPIALGCVTAVLNANDGAVFDDTNAVIGGQNTTVAMGGSVGTTTMRALANVGTPNINGVSSSDFAPLDTLKVLTSNNALTTAEPTGWRVGQDRTNTARRWNGNMSELVAFPALLTTEQRQQLERNQGAYYGVTVA